MSGEVLIAGAGPAGCAAAIALRQLGVPVLLVDRARFPRPKVCGCCLGPAALAELRDLGVDPLAQDDALALQRLALRVAGVQVDLALGDGVVASREALDLRLLQRAEAAGARVITGTRALLAGVVAGGREVILTGDRETRRTFPLVLLATGLPGSGATGVRHPAARVGLSQTRHSLAGPLPASVMMAAASGGYVGLVRLADGVLNVAASISTAALQSAGSPGAAVDAVLRACGERPLGWEDGWRGTPPLRHCGPHDHGDHVLAVGDAAGFWEPFTGEGIGWALRGGRAVAAPAARLAERWDRTVALQWRSAQRRWLRAAQRHSRVVADVASRPRLAAMLIAALRFAPTTTVQLLSGRRIGPVPA